MSVSEPRDPHGAHDFVLEIEGELVARLFRVSGLVSRTQVFELVEGGRNDRAHRLAGAATWDDLTLTFGIGVGRGLDAWRDAFLQDPFEPSCLRSGAVVLLGEDGEPARRYEFERAWPVSWEGPNLDAGVSAVATETLVIAHEGLRVVTP